MGPADGSSILSVRENELEITYTPDGGDGGSDAGASRFVVLPLVFAGVALLGGLISFSGWVIDVPALADWDRDGIAIQPNPSLMLVLGALGVILHHYGVRRAVTVLGAIVVLVGGLTLVQHLFAVNLGIDTPLTFGREWGDQKTVSPGRMGPIASVCSLLAGLSLVFVSLRRADGNLRRAVPMLSLCVVAVSS